MHAEIDWSKTKGDLKSFSWDKNALGQSDFRILESTISEIRVDG